MYAVETVMKAMAEGKPHDAINRLRSSANVARYWAIDAAAGRIPRSTKMLPRLYWGNDWFRDKNKLESWKKRARLSAIQYSSLARALPEPLTSYRDSGQELAYQKHLKDMTAFPAENPAFGQLVPPCEPVLEEHTYGSYSDSDSSFGSERSPLPTAVAEEGSVNEVVPAIFASSPHRQYSACHQGRDGESDKESS